MNWLGSESSQRITLLLTICSDEADLGRRTMKSASLRTKWCMLGPLIIFAVLVHGCGTTGGRSIKTHRLYTTLEPPELVALAGFSGPGPIEQDSFAPGQRPVAVIIGYGGRRVTLEIVERNTGRSVGKNEIYVDSDMVGCATFNITNSGNYKLRLLEKGAEQNSFKFMVAQGMPKMDGNDSIISRMDAALQRDARDAYAYSTRGHAYEGKREFDKAISDYTQAISLLPNDVALRISRGRTYLAHGDTNEAINDFTEVIRLNADAATAYIYRGFAYQKKGDWDKPISDYSEILRRNPDTEAAYILRGFGYNKKGEFEKAITDYTEAIRRNPDNALAYYYRGLVSGKKGVFEKEVSDFREAIRRNPKLGIAYNQLAWVLASCPADRVRDGKAAVTTAWDACEMAEWKDAAWIDTLAAAYAEAGDFEKAVKYENQALATPVPPGVDGTETREQLARMQQRLSLYEQGHPYREELTR